MRGFTSVMVAMVCLAALVFGISFLDDWLHNSDYPEMLQKHLANLLSAEDYEQLTRIAKQNPEQQTWIDAVTDADGQILYRDAEQLKKRINQYLKTLLQKELRDVVRSGLQGAS